MADVNDLKPPSKSRQPTDSNPSRQGYATNRLVDRSPRRPRLPGASPHQRSLGLPPLERISAAGLTLWGDQHHPRVKSSRPRPVHRERIREPVREYQQQSRLNERSAIVALARTSHRNQTHSTETFAGFGNSKNGQVNPTVHQRKGVGVLPKLAYSEPTEEPRCFAQSVSRS